jgi:hypothetical protein
MTRPAHVNLIVGSYDHGPMVFHPLVTTHW